MPSTSAWTMATDRLAASLRGALPDRLALGDLLRPDRHELLVAPLYHDRHRELVQAGLIEVDGVACHRPRPASLEARAAQLLGNFFGLGRFRALDRLNQHVETDRVLERLVHHEVAVLLAEALGQLRVMVVVRRRDGQHTFGKFPQSLLEIGNYVARGTPN